MLSRFFILSFMLLSTVISASSSDSLAIHQYLDNAFKSSLENNPEFAASIGLKINYGKWNERTDEHYKREFMLMLEVADNIKKFFNFANVDKSTQLSVELYEHSAKQMEANFKWRFHQYNISQLNGDHVDVPNFLINIHRIDNVQDANDYISRLEGIETIFQQDIYYLTEQKKRHIAPPLFTFKYVKDDILKMVNGLETQDEKNILYQDFKQKVNALNIAENEKNDLLQKALNVLITKVKQSYKTLLLAVQDLETIAKTNNGAWALPDGDVYYKHQLLDKTTTNLSSNDIYETGLKEVERIHNEIIKMMKEIKTPHKTLKDFFVYLKTDKKFMYPNTDEGRNNLLSRSRNYIQHIDSLIPNYFNTLPVAKCVVLPVEKFREASAAGAFYEQPSEDGSRPGRFYVNLQNMESEKTYELEALAYHEAIPGHHMQISIAQELKNVPKFRKYDGNNAYIEGWALYSEYLAKDMGLYQNWESEVGRLSMELFRAARLVIDVGIHQKKWSVEKATAYMFDNTLNSDLDCKREIERYFLWPGQATSYKIGMLHILKLRNEAQQQMGDKFNLKTFHDIVLKNGAVPLYILTNLIHDWIKSKA